MLCSEIQENKEQTQAAMDNIHKVLNAFQEEFQNKLLDLGQDLHRQIDEEHDEFKKHWDGYHERM